MADDIVDRLKNLPYATGWSCDSSAEQWHLAAAAEIERLRDLCYEAQAFIEHNKNCSALMGWAKDCSCGYDEMWRKLNV